MNRTLNTTTLLIAFSLSNIAAFTVMAQPAEQVGEPEIQLSWHTSLEEAKAESKRTGKPILMELHGRPWCPPCVIQGKQIMRHPDFINWAHDKFVLLEIQVGEGYSPSKGSPIWVEQFQKHRLPVIPATVLLNSELQAMGTVYPKTDVSQWLGAAKNIVTAHALRRQNVASEPKQVIPFRITPANNMSVPATLDGRIALNLMFHTGADAVSVTEQTTSMYPELVFDNRVASESWGGKSEVRFGKSRLAIGPLAAEEVTLFEDVNSGSGTDGKFGPNQLPADVIHLDFEQLQIGLFSKAPNEITAETTGWRKLELRRESGMMFVSATLSSKLQESSAEFMLHSGYSGFGLLSRGFVSDTSFLKKLPVEEQSSLLDAAGNRLTTKLVRIPELQVGGERLRSVPISFFDGALGTRRYNVLGCDFLRRFNWCFDLTESCVYLKRSSHFESDYFSSTQTK